MGRLPKGGFLGSRRGEWGWEGGEFSGVDQIPTRTMKDFSHLHPGIRHELDIPPGRKKQATY